MDELITYLQNNEISCSNKQIEQFTALRVLELDWNKKVNLTAITDPKEFVIKHFIDSLLIVNEDFFTSATTVIDIGTGGGFPGLPLAILYPNKHFCLADSLQKRIRIIDDIISRLNLENVSTVHGRAEEIGRNATYRESFDLCVSRAVANLSTLAEYCLPVTKQNGYFVAYKGPKIEEEFASAKKSIQTLGGGKTKVLFKSYGEYNHSIIAVQKCSKTPSIYPRKPGMPSKEPII